MACRCLLDVQDVSGVSNVWLFLSLPHVLTSDKSSCEGENGRAKTLMTAAGHDKWVLSLQKLFAQCYSTADLIRLPKEYLFL